MSYTLIKKHMFGHFPQILKFGRDVVRRHTCRAWICRRLWSAGIDSKESIPPAYVAWRAGTSNSVIVYEPARLHKLTESIPWNRFLGSWNVYKFGLWKAPPLRGSLYGFEPDPFQNSINFFLQCVEYNAHCCPLTDVSGWLGEPNLSRNPIKFLTTTVKNSHPCLLICG
jgi:hypothetical protein